jgi:uncharacterized protein (DUF433 family)
VGFVPISYPPLSFCFVHNAGRERPIVIDPRIAFGRPVVVRAGVSPSAIAERIDAGETVEAIAADYDLGPSEIEEAEPYERAA